MTPTLCSTLCTGFKFLGVQNHRECYCGNDYGNAGGKDTETACSRPCDGNKSITCGGGNHNSIYKIGPSGGHAVLKAVASADGSRGRVLYVPKGATANLTNVLITGGEVISGDLAPCSPPPAAPLLPGTA